MQGKNMRNAGHITDAEIEKLKINKNKVFYKSNFCFLCHHNGLRPEKIHILMGTSGSGKSTLMRSIITDFVTINPETIFFWLSEESTDDVLATLYDLDVCKSRLTQIIVKSELEGSENSDEILRGVVALGCKVMVIDNITTSRFYMDKDPSEQATFITKLKNFGAKNGIAIVLVAHTKKDIHDNFGRLITEGDIRGSGAPIMMAEFFYIMQKFETSGVFTPTLRIVKHRGQEVSERLYYLVYEAKTSSYVSDHQIDFQRFKELFKSRNVL